MLDHVTPSEPVIRSVAVRYGVIAAVLGASALAIYLWWLGKSELISMEYGPVEMLHELLTGAACIVFFDAYRRGAGAVKVAGGALAMLLAAATIRELDVKKIDGPEVWNWLTHHGLQEVLFVGMIIPIFIYLFRQRSHFSGLMALLFSWRAWPLYLGGACMVLSLILEKRFVHDVHTQFWEEFAETYGYGLFLMAAFRHRQLVGSEPERSEDAARS